MSCTLSLRCQLRLSGFSAGTTLKSYTDVSAKLMLRERRNRILTESVESVECLHNWLLSGLIDGVLTQMDVSALMDLDE